MKSLDISYNRLRPDVLASVLTLGLVPSVCQLEYLDISGNSCNGVSGRVLGDFLTSSECRLQCLKMNACGMNSGKYNNTAIVGMKEVIMNKIQTSIVHEEEEDVDTYQQHIQNTSLEDLELGGNPREDENLDMYNFLFTKFVKLTKLKLAELVIKDEEVAIVLMNSFFSCQNLCCLCL